ncbi:CPBP family intramembrane glutamic endopeptidase [Natronorarus salvus]|uniref:CPBP family intramembrane glutamic endopeptidase n=1 Tax=Natronorarus salvus TaxID=3117733 RepID=UPI002F26702F
MENASEVRRVSAIRVLGESVGVAVAGFLVGIVFTFAAAAVLLASGVPLLEQPLIEIVVSVVMLQGVGFGSVALGYIYFSRHGFDILWLRVPTLSDVIWTVLGLVGLFVALIALNLVLLTFGVESAEHSIVGLGGENPEILLVMIPLSILLIGPGEELLFRGVIQRILVDRFGIWAGIAVASVIFAVAHVGALVATDPAQLTSTLGIYVALSLILGGVYERSGNLVVPSVIHGLFNAIQFGLLYYTLTSDVDLATLLVVG